MKDSTDNVRLQESISELHSRSDCGRSQQPGIIERAIEELRSALGELQVIEEELRFQHDELLMARKDADDVRRRWRQLFDLIPDGCLVTDVNGKIREANRAAQALLRAERESIVGRGIAELVAEDQRAGLPERLSQVSRLGRITGWQVRIQGVGGEPLDARLNVGAILDANDEVVGLHWIIRAA